MSSSKKFYAVRKGLNIGIFKTWDECKALVIGFKGAEYKSFPTEKLANEYLGISNGVVETNSMKEMNGLINGMANLNIERPRLNIEKSSLNIERPSLNIEK